MPYLVNKNQEFGYGFYDGISGIVTQPLDGAKKQGFAGFLKGFGKGIGGIVLKPGAGMGLKSVPIEPSADDSRYLGSAWLYI